MNRETFEQICQDVTDDFVSTNLRDQDEVNFLDAVHRKIAQHYNVFPDNIFPVKQKVEGISPIEEYKWNISRRVSPNKFDFDCLEVLGEDVNKVLDKYHGKI